MIIGLTGGIGTGKSTVSRYLINKGYVVIDADFVSREVSERGDILDKLADEFGTELIVEGNLDRRALRKKVFSSRDRIRKLNEILHPPIIERIKYYIDVNRGREPIFLDIPLLFECNLEYLSDMVILVDCQADIQLLRVMERDRVEVEEARAIIDKQMPMEFKRGKADYIIENNEGIIELEEKIEKFLKGLNKKA
jgi:dephospho-CoA kinase